MAQRSKITSSVIGRAPAPLEGIADKKWRRAEKLAALLRPTIGQPLRQVQAARIARIAKISLATLWRHRRRLAEQELTSALLDRPPGFRPEGNRLSAEQHSVVLQVIEQLQRRGHRLRVIDVVAEVEQRCRTRKIDSPTRRSVDRRIAQFAPHLVERRSGNVDRLHKGKPGHYQVDHPLDVVQIDHTRCDIMVVDDLYRQAIGRPVLSVALDVATRCVVGLLVTFEAPSAATVALLLTRVVSDKAAWLRSLGLSIKWPMGGLPRSLHLDNAPEFHSVALQRGCTEFAVELIYRPQGRPHFGGHIERFIGTLMSRLKALPGSTGASVRQRKNRRPEKTATLTLQEFEHWLAIEIGERYHHSEHSGLPGATPFGAWQVAAPLTHPIKHLAAFNSAFLPAVERKVHRGGFSFNHIYYWHAALFGLKDRRIVVHYDPADIGKLYVILPDKTLLQVPYAQTHRPAVALWEVLAANKYLRATSTAMISEDRLFKAIQAQRQVIAKAATKTKKARLAVTRATDRGRTRAVLNADRGIPDTQSQVDYSQPVEGYPAEIW